MEQSRPCIVQRYIVYTIMSNHIQFLRLPPVSTMVDIKHIIAVTAKRYKTTGLLLAFMLFWAPAIVFAKLAGGILEREPIGTDITILNWIHSWNSPLHDQIFLFFTTIGSVEYILPLTVIALAYLLYRKFRLNALVLMFGVGGAAISNVILKLIFHRDRPAFWHSLITETGYSFPSGHAMMSSSLVFCFIVLLWSPLSYRYYRRVECQPYLGSYCYRYC